MEGRHKGRFRQGMDRKTALTLQKELENVGKKSLTDIKIAKGIKSKQPLNDGQQYSRQILSEFTPRRYHDKRKTEPVFHDDLQNKTRRGDSPTRGMAVYNPLDRYNTDISMPEADATNKYPFAREDTITTETMKKPHVTSLGVLPPRQSHDIDGLHVLMEGKPVLKSEDPILGPVQRANTAPLIADEQPEQPPPTPDIPAAFMPPDILTKPAILGEKGTTQAVVLKERPSPPEKPHTRFKPSVRAPSAKSVQSDTSSFRSMDIYLPAEYGTAGTAKPTTPGSRQGRRKVSKNKPDSAPEDYSGCSSAHTVKSVKDLLAEAKQIASPGGEKIVTEQKQKLKEDKAKAAQKKKGEHGKTGAGSKGEGKGKAGKEAKAAGPRSVDQIIASLKDPSKANEVSEADKKIQEIMEKMMTHSKAVLGDLGIDITLEDSEQGGEERGDSSHQLGVSHTTSPVDTLGQQEDTKPEADEQGTDGDIGTETVISATDTSVQPIPEGGSMHTQIMKEALEQLAEANKPDETEETNDNVAAEEENKEEDDDRENVQLPVFGGGIDLKQAWDDLLASPNVAYEDIVQIKAKPTQLHERTQPAGKSTVSSHSTESTGGLLGSWTPATNDEPAQPQRKSIHHFCQQRENIQLPDHLRGVWRKYHVPSKCRFWMEGLQEQATEVPPTPVGTAVGNQSPEGPSSVDLDRTEREQSAAARRILAEISRPKENLQQDALAAWQDRAQQVFDATELDVAGKKMKLKSDESFLYWTPAPPKWDVAPARVKASLFPQYHGAALASEAMSSGVLMTGNEEDSEIMELPDQNMEDPEETLARERTLLRTYGSARDLTDLTKDQLEQKEIEKNTEMPDLTTEAVNRYDIEESVSPPPASLGGLVNKPKSGAKRITSAAKASLSTTSNAQCSDTSSIAIPTKQVKGSFRITNRHFSSDLANKFSASYKIMQDEIVDVINPLFYDNFGEIFKDILDVDFRPGSLCVQYCASLTLDASDDIGSDIQRVLRNAAINNQLEPLEVDPLSIKMQGDINIQLPTSNLTEEKERTFTALPTKNADNFPPTLQSRKRRNSAPGKADAEDEDMLMVYQDFNILMDEISKQKKQLKETGHHKALEPDENLESLDEAIVDDVSITEEREVEEERPRRYSLIETMQKAKTKTASELALEAGRAYILLPPKRKKKRKKVDMSRVEALERFLGEKSQKISRSNSLPRTKREIEKEFRVPLKTRTRIRGSVPDLFDFDGYLKKNGCRKADTDEQREYTRNIWNRWFDDVYPPTPPQSDWDDDEPQAEEEPQPQEEIKRKPSATGTVYSDNIEVQPVIEDDEHEEMLQLLEEEVARLTKDIQSSKKANPFSLCRRGALLRKLGRIGAALSDLNLAIAREPDLVDAYWHRHLIFLLQNKRTQALDDVNYILKHNKGHSQAYKSRAMIFKDMGDTTMAIVNFSQAIKQNPNDDQTYFQRAEMYEQRGEVLLAMEDYGAANKLNPTKTEALLRHGKHYFKNGNWNSAINDFTDLLKQNPNDAVARTYRGRAFSNLKQWNAAVRDLSAAIHLDPNNAVAFYYRGCILRKLHPKKALQDLSTSLLIDDSEDNQLAYLHRGILYNDIGRHEDAIPDFEAVLRLDSQMACAHVNLGLIYMLKSENYHRALKRFTAAMRADPTYLKAYVCRSDCYTRMHDIKNALLDITRAIHLRPDIHHHYMYRGQLILKMGNLDLAAFCVKHAAELNAGLGQSPTQQAIVQTFLKNYDKAVEALEGATRVQPVAPLFMLLGKTQMKAQSWKDAVESFQKAVEAVIYIAQKPWQKKQTWPPEAAEMYHLMGMCYTEMRDYSSAHDAFNNAIRIDLKFAEAFYQRGLTRMRLKQARAVQDLNKALALDPQLFQAYLSRAAYYGLKGNYPKGILNCNEAIRLQPNSVRSYLYRGALKCMIRAYDLAIRDLTQAIAIDNTCSLAYFNRAVCYHQSRRWQKALQDYGIVLLLGDYLKLKVLINRGLLYYSRRDYHNALHDFLMAVQVFPKDKNIHHTLGLCYHKINHLEKAVQSFTTALEIDTFFADAIISRGNVFMDFGHSVGMKFARRDYERVIQRDPCNLPARVNLAYTLQVAGSYQQAWHQFTAAIDINQKYKPALEGRAVINLQMSDTFAAFHDISASIRAGATAELLTNRGVIHQFMGERVSAMRDYQEALQLDPAYALAYFNAANVYFYMRQFQQALDYYTKALQHNPKDESAFLNRAITKVLLRDGTSALEDFNRAIHLSPYSAHMYFNRANLYTSMEDYLSAEKDYTTALSLQPDDPLVCKRRADVRGKLGRREDAVQDYKHAIEIQSLRHRDIAPQMMPVC